MKISITSINLSILSLGVATLYYFLNFTPILYSLSIDSLSSIINIFQIIESVIVVFALILGIKEKNKAGIVLSVLLLIMFNHPFLSQIATRIYWLLQ